MVGGELVANTPLFGIGSVSPACVFVSGLCSRWQGPMGGPWLLAPASWSCVLDNLYSP